jgi:hypothetical protein
MLIARWTRAAWRAILRAVEVRCKISKIESCFFRFLFRGAESFREARQN